MASKVIGMATLNAAWTDTLAHVPTLLLAWLCAIVVYVVTVLIGFVISLVFWCSW